MSAPFAHRPPEGSHEYDPTYRLERIVKDARRDMGEARWRRLQQEWDRRP